MPLLAEKQVVIIYAGTKGFLDGLPVAKLGAYEKGFYAFIDSKYPQIFETLRTKKVLDKELEATLKTALDAYGKAFGKGDS